MKTISKTLLTTIVLFGSSTLFANATPIKNITSSGFNLIVNASNGYDYDRYSDRPVYFYNGRHYYGGHYNNGYYNIGNQRFTGGRYFAENRLYQYQNVRNSILSLIALPLLVHNSNYGYANNNMYYRIDNNRHHRFSHRDRNYRSGYDIRREYEARNHRDNRHDRGYDNRYDNRYNDGRNIHREHYEEDRRR